MTTYRTLSRSLAALSAIVALATGAVLIAAPSTARAEAIDMEDQSAFMDFMDESFMEYTDDAYMPVPVNRQAGAANSRAFRDAGATTVPTTTTTVPATPATGIIMRDGGICDPIRHMGC